MPPPVSVSRTTTAPPQAVWDVLTDLDRAAQVISGIVAVERLAGPGYAVGTRWRETRRMFGKEASEEMEVTAVEPPRRTVVEAESGGTHYVTTLTVEPEGAGSRVGMAFRATTSGLLARVLGETLGRLAMGATRKVCEQDLADITAEAERRAAAG